MARRLSLILDERADSVIESFLRAGTAHHEALRRWARMHGTREVRSEAAALRVLLEIGAISLRDEVLDSGYAELAVEWCADEERSERRAARDRYAARSDAAR